MKLNGDGPVGKSKPLALKYVAKTTKAHQVWESEEAYHIEGSEDVSNDEEMTLIIKRIYILCKKLGHFTTDCPEVQRTSKKGRFQKDSFINKFKKSLMETCDELDNEEDFEKDEEHANLALMALTSYGEEFDSDSSSKSEEEDEVFSKLSRSYLINFIQDLMGRCR
ncbi:hypothetical protein KIW84_032694 [Lathyrus oleraceus]|uniref:Uncharacterized protein n=1 Tax=Pisum sativum TaxID=3888 RepID=A0A9D4XVZ9_PEA|nr:hypothetical protein KIW84_032694 [Pisum sativum]